MLNFFSFIHKLFSLYRLYIFLFIIWVHKFHQDTNEFFFKLVYLTRKLFNLKTEVCHFGDFILLFVSSCIYYFFSNQSFPSKTALFSIIFYFFSLPNKLFSSVMTHLWFSYLLNQSSSLKHLSFTVRDSLWLTSGWLFAIPFYYLIASVKFTWHLPSGS